MSNDDTYGNEGTYDVFLLESNFANDLRSLISFKPNYLIDRPCDPIRNVDVGLKIQLGVRMRLHIVPSLWHTMSVY